jgi:hypothetical protein
MDSGSDVTLVPLSIVHLLGAVPRGLRWLLSHDHTSTRCYNFLLPMTVEGYEIPAVSCLATDRNNVLLGRDVLNHFVITLDGKNLVFSLTP